MSTARNLGIRLDKITATRLENFENSTGVDGVTLGRILLNSALDYFESHKALDGLSLRAWIWVVSVTCV